MTENLSFSIERVSPLNSNSPDRNSKSFTGSQFTNLQNSCPLSENASKSTPFQSPSRKSTNAGLSQISLNSPEKRKQLRESPLQSYLKKEENTPPKKRPAESKVDISWVAIDFGSVQCGRTLGSCISFTSKTKSTLHVRLSIDKKTEHFDGDEIFALVNKEDYISVPTKQDFKEKGASNSQLKHKSWFLEQPKTKELASSLSVVVKPKQSANVIVVLRTPDRCRPGSVIAAMVDLKLLDKESVEMQRVFLFGRIERFPILFPKEVCSLMNPTRVIPIAFKFTPGQSVLAQKFKLPMKNQHPDKEVEVSFTPMRNNAGQPISRCFEVFVIPGSVSIPPGASGFVNLMIKMNLDADGKRPSIQKGEKILKALVANAKQSSLVYGLFLEILLISANPSLSEE